MYELFPAPQQGEMVGRILSVFTREDMAVAVPWIVSLLDADDAGAYINVLSNAMPPTDYDDAKGWIRNGVTGSAGAR